jgi:hypothetical protein
VDYFGRKPYWCLYSKSFTVRWWTSFSETTFSSSFERAQMRSRPVVFTFKLVPRLKYWDYTTLLYGLDSLDGKIPVERLKLKM